MRWQAVCKLIYSAIWCSLGGHVKRKSAGCRLHSAPVAALSQVAWLPPLLALPLTCFPRSVFLIPSNNNNNSEHPGGEAVPRHPLFSNWGKEGSGLQRVCEPGPL